MNDVAVIPVATALPSGMRVTLYFSFAGSMNPPFTARGASQVRVASCPSALRAGVGMAVRLSVPNQRDTACTGPCPALFVAYASTVWFPWALTGTVADTCAPALAVPLAACVPSTLTVQVMAPVAAVPS